MTVAKLVERYVKGRGRKYARESSDSKKKGSRRVWCVWFNDEKAGFLLGACRFVALISSS